MMTGAVRSVEVLQGGRVSRRVEAGSLPGLLTCCAVQFSGHFLLRVCKTRLHTCTLRMAPVLIMEINSN